MNTFRKNKAGEWVIQGIAGDLQIGVARVQKASGQIRQVYVTSLGKPFCMNGQQMVYGYFVEMVDAPAAKVPSTPPPSHHNEWTHVATHRAPATPSFEEDPESAAEFF